MLRMVPLILTAGLALGMVWPAGPARGGDGADGAAIGLAQEKCVQLVRQSGNREVLANTCAVCQVVKVERTRTGGALPDFRTFVVLPRNTFNLPFKGPGRTRMVGVSACKG